MPTIRGLTGTIKNIPIKRVTQYQERDIEFLARLAQEYGHSFKIVGNKLVFVDNAELKQRPAVAVLLPEDIIRIRLRDLIKGVPSKVDVKGYDPKSKQTVSASRSSKSRRGKAKHGSTGDTLRIVPNTHECKHLSPLLEGLPKGTTVYADKGYDSAENRQHLKEHQLQDGIMRKAHRKHPPTEAQTKCNRYLSKTRYVVEQSFGTLHRKFRYARAAYFGLLKVSAQSHLKAMCLNLLKAANRLSVPVAA